MENEISKGVLVDLAEWAEDDPDSPLPPAFDRRGLLNYFEPVMPI